MGIKRLDLMAKIGYIRYMNADIVFLSIVGIMIASMMFCVVKATEGDEYES